MVEFWNEIVFGVHLVKVYVDAICGGAVAKVFNLRERLEVRRAELLEDQDITWLNGSGASLDNVLGLVEPPDPDLGTVEVSSKIHEDGGLTRSGEATFSFWQKIHIDSISQIR